MSVRKNCRAYNERINHILKEVYIMSKKVNGNEEMNQEEMNNIPETPETEKERRPPRWGLRSVRGAAGCMSLSCNLSKAGRSMASLPLLKP